MALSACSVDETATDTGLTAQRIVQLEERLARAESIRAIKRLQYAYGHYVEFGLWHDFADLFTEDAVAHYPAGDLGREAIRDLFFDQVGGGQLGLAEGRLYPHFVLQPVVTLNPDGTTAHGRWHVLTLLGGLGGNATWVGGLYENDYVLEDGVWKISELRTYTQFSGSYADGWTSPPRAPATQDGICENYLVNDCTIAFHYDAARAGDPLGLADSTGAVDESAALALLDAAELEARAMAADRRVTRLLDESAVRNLQHSYGYHFEQRRWDELADLFAADATYELGLRGVYRGRSSIRGMLEQFGPAGGSDAVLDDRLQLETIVTIAPDGLTARARGVEFALWATREDDEPRSEWREAIFDNTYIKQDGVWKISAMHLYPRFATDYARGWGEDARPAPEASADYPPDEPPTVTHGVYPEFHIPPFHFVNPVTGAPPQYPDRPDIAGERYAVIVAAGPAAGPRAVDLEETERRLAIAVADDAVENIANAYAFYLDEFDHDAAMDLFVVGGRVELDDAGLIGERERIRAAIDMAYSGAAEGRPEGFFAIHQTLQPVIDVADDGATASIRYRLFEPAGRIGEDGFWIAGAYTADAVNRDGTWKLERLAVNLRWAAGYTEGWAGAAR